MSIRDRIEGKAICDGRGNAGTGARAVVLYWWDDGIEFRRERAEKIEPTTNIVAEHLAIQLAMETALDIGITDLEIMNDSQTPVFQTLGTYEVKADHLKEIVQRSWELGRRFDFVSIKWVPREETTEADALCRRVDRPKPTVGSPFRLGT